mmetsp:Transcript_40903/g.63853  ORF Transcript_40903/g.63853 Transcript_40903/m.63853 type:complete len:174 (+) Transcript_40903:395-916(+)
MMDDFSLEHKQAVGASAPAAIAPPQVSNKNFRLVKEIEDEEMAFKRATTKAALDIAKEETDKAIERAARVEKLCEQLNERMQLMEKTFQKQLEDLKQESNGLKAELTEAQAENRGLKNSLEQLQNELMVNEKHGQDLEDALYYLQDEIAKPKPAPKAESPLRGAKGARAPVKK